jgi:iron complex transport system ATP-binding protein
MSLVRRVVDEHRIAAVMSMHDLNMALRHADKAIFLKGGTIHAMTPVCGVTADIISDVYGLPVAIHHFDGQPVIIPTT